MINLVQYINEKLVIFPSQVDEKLVIFPSQVDEKLVIFPSQVDEKLVINKNFKVTENFKRGNDFTQEYGYTVSKQLEEKYAKLHDNKNTIYHTHSFCHRWDREELEKIVNAKIYNKTNNIEDKNFIYVFSFDIFGLKNITFMTYVFEDNFSIILLKKR